MIATDNKFQQLLAEVKQRFGKPLVVNGDFVALSQDINRVTGSRISTTTLKRYWKHKDTNWEPTGNVHNSTLNIMTAYLGYSDYETFEKETPSAPTDTSTRINNAHIVARNLSAGQQLCLTWAPNRKVIIRHDTDNQFTVISSINSKLKSGDHFEVDNIVSRCPLLLFNLQSADSATTDYICAQNYSLGVELV